MPTLKEFRFRDIPWSIPADQYQEQLLSTLQYTPENKPEFSTKLCRVYMSSYCEIQDCGHWRKHSIGENGYVLIWDAPSQGFKIMGLPVYAIAVSAIPEDLSQKELEKCQALFAAYVFDTLALEASEYDRLKTEMTAANGQPDVEQAGPRRSFAVWYGANDTYNELYLRNDEDGDLADLMIFYGLTNAPARFEKLYRQMNEQREKNAL